MAYTTIAKPSAHFDCPTWTGSSSTTTVSGMSFKPDSIWIKRYDGTGHPVLNNSSLGTAKNWIPSGNNAVDTTTYVASYTSDGFTWSQLINNDVTEDELFKLKLNLFEQEAVQNSKKSEQKASLRKATSVDEAFYHYASIAGVNGK